MNAIATEQRPLALVTGASSGIGYELAICCAHAGYDLLVAADEPKIEEAADYFRSLGVKIDAVLCDLSTLEGVDRLYEAKGERPIDLAPKETKLFMEQYHKTLKNLTMKKLEGRVASLEQRITTLTSR